MTRVANVTGLDYIGIPVVVSVRPGARSLSVQQGKGLTLEAAKASAIMESVESFSAQRPLRHHIGTIESLDGAAFELPDHLLQRPLEGDERIPWVQGYDRLNGEAVQVPEELVTTNFSWPLPEGHGRFVSSSNGLAAGNTASEAVLHGLCELIERDALSLWTQAPAEIQERTRLDPSAITDPGAASLIAQYRSAAIEVQIWDITSDLEVPSFFCVIDDPRGRPPFLGRFGGLGSHPSCEVALMRVLTEAAQSRLTFIVGSREDIDPASYSLVGWRRNLGHLLQPSPGPSPKGVSSVRARSIDTDTVDEDLQVVLDFVRSRGIERVVVVDLTDPELQIPCVRVLAFDLEAMHDNPAYVPGGRALRMLRQWT